MKKIQFPVFKTKIKGLSERFNLSDPIEREKYFQAKAGEEIKEIKNYFERDTFIAYMLAKKSAGKGTYAHMLTEIFGPDKVAHLSIGDIVRAADEEVTNPQKRKELEDFLRQSYRGFQSLEEIIEAQEQRSTKTLLPTEFILALIEREIGRLGRKALLVDGFPRGLDQISYSLFFRALVGYREDPDFFILIQVPEKVIDERMRYRVVCPLCQVPRNLKLFPTKEVGYDQQNNEFFLRCDNPACNGARMTRKEGDELGIENIRERIKKDEELIERVFSLYGIPKIFLRNAVPVEMANEYVDDYELTPAYSYSWDEKAKKVVVKEEPWVVKDDNGQDSYSLLAPPVVVSLIKQIAEVLSL